MASLELVDGIAVSHPFKVLGRGNPYSHNKNPGIPKRYPGIFIWKNIYLPVSERLSEREFVDGIDEGLGRSGDDVGIG